MSNQEKKSSSLPLQTLPIPALLGTTALLRGSDIPTQAERDTIKKCTKYFWEYRETVSARQRACANSQACANHKSSRAEEVTQPEDRRESGMSVHKENGQQVGRRERRAG